MDLTPLIVLGVLVLALGVSVAVFFGLLYRPVEQRQPESIVALTERLLAIEGQRLQSTVDMDARRNELELGRLRLEMEHLAETGAEHRKNVEQAAELKERRRAQTLAAREARLAKRAARGPLLFPGMTLGCEECAAIAEHRETRHSDHLIIHATQRHSESPNGALSS